MRKLLLSSLALFAVIAFAISTTKAKDEKSAAVAIGSPAPEFALQDQDGKDVKLSDYEGKVVVLEWFNDGCPYVVKHYKNGDMNKLAQKYSEKGVIWLAINSTSSHNAEHNKKIAGEWNIDRPILSDASGEVGRLYGAKTTPHMYVINKDRSLVYMGAIDDDRSNDAAKVPGAKNYVAAALDAVLDGKAVETSETKPYGCSVKYAK